MTENYSLAEKTVLRYVIKNLRRSIERRDKKSLEDLWGNLFDVVGSPENFSNEPYEEELGKLNHRIKELFDLLEPSDDYPEYRRLNAEERKKEALRCASEIESIIVNKLGISKKETLGEKRSRTKGGITLERRKELEDAMKRLKLGVEQEDPDAVLPPMGKLVKTLSYVTQEVTGYASNKWIRRIEDLANRMSWSAEDHIDSAVYKGIRSLINQLEPLLVKRFGLDTSVKKIGIVPASKITMKDGRMIIVDELTPRKSWHKKKT